MSSTGAKATDVSVQSCPSTIVPVHAIEATTYYRRDDPSRSTIDPVKHEENLRLIKPVDDFLKTVSDLSDRYVSTGDHSWKECADNLMVEWAAGKGLLDVSSGAQARFMQQWASSTLGFSRIKLGPIEDPVQRGAVNSWLMQIAKQVYDRNIKEGERKRNNHYYWSMLGVGAIGVAVHDETLWQESRRMYSVAITDVREDGTLPAELSRGKRAALYHAFAAQPLALYNLLATYCEKSTLPGHGSLDALMRLVRDEIDDRKIIDKKTKVLQSHVGQQHWLLLWDAMPDNVALISPKLRSVKLGGQMTTLAATLRAGCSSTP